MELFIRHFSKHRLISFLCEGICCQMLGKLLDPVKDVCILFQALCITDFSLSWMNFNVGFHHYVSKISVLFSKSVYVVIQSVHKFQLNVTDIFCVFLCARHWGLWWWYDYKPDLALGPEGQSVTGRQVLVKQISGRDRERPFMVLKRPTHPYICIASHGGRKVHFPQVYLVWKSLNIRKSWKNSVMNIYAVRLELTVEIFIFSFFLFSIWPIHLPTHLPTCCSFLPSIHLYVYVSLFTCHLSIMWKQVTEIMTLHPKHFSIHLQRIIMLY